MKKLNAIIDYDLDVNVYGITDDYRLVRDGYIFVATKGYFVDHFKYINKAIDNGCVFLVVDRKMEINFPHIIVDNINDYYILLCKKYYEIDLNNYNFYGVTGTDGKTTTASIVSQLIDSCAYIGTNGLIIGTEEFSISNTTPCVSELYDSLNKINKRNIKNVSMEVSSEALLHDRVKNFHFKIVGITNVTGDHLSVHKSFFNYLKCKLKILDLIDDDGVAFINGDDKNLKKISLNKKCYTYGFSKKCDFYIKRVEKKDRFLLIVLVDKINNKNNEILSPFFEKFNIYNVVLAFLIAKNAGIDENVIIEKIKKLNRVKGRCEELNFGQKFKIVLDYAHTIHAVESILDVYKNQKLIVVTGAAGGRDKEKRPIIGQMVIDNSDVAIFTMDDPRYEDVDEIIDQMVGKNSNYIRLINRKKAIEYALSIASDDSVVLVIGKGRDNYMAIENRKIPYSDYEVIKNFFLRLYCIFVLLDKVLNSN